MIEWYQLQKTAFLTEFSFDCSWLDNKNELCLTLSLDSTAELIASDRLQSSVIVLWQSVAKGVQIRTCKFVITGFFWIKSDWLTDWSQHGNWLIDWLIDLNCDYQLLLSYYRNNCPKTVRYSDVSVLRLENHSLNVFLFTFTSRVKWE